jgi:hypothetical protein
MRIMNSSRQYRLVVCCVYQKIRSVILGGANQKSLVSARGCSDRSSLPRPNCPLLSGMWGFVLMLDYCEVQIPSCCNVRFRSFAEVRRDQSLPGP